MWHASPSATLALALGLGILATLIARRFNIPALILLMVTGGLVGQSGLRVVDAVQLGPALSALINVAVAILIFEGTLHLDRSTLGHAPKAVRGLLTVGAGITWLGVTAAGQHLLGLPVPVAVVLGAVLIVTGPTVIQPLLKRVKLTPRLHSSLLSEGILIDPLGVLATVVTLEVVLAQREIASGTEGLRVAWAYLYPFVAGGVPGLVIGWPAAWLLGRDVWHGKAGDQGAILVGFGACMVAAGLGELLHHEAGLVATTIVGLLIAWLAKPRLVAMRHAAESLAGVLVGMLFVLLAARFDLSRVADVGTKEIAFVAVVMFLVRPVAALLSTWRSAMSVPERLYLCLVAPRGIVAVSAAALAATALAGARGGEGAPGQGVTVLVETASSTRAQNAQALELAVLLVVVTSVAWASLAAGPLASLLRVRGAPSSGVLLVGSHELGRALARAISAHKVPVLLLDRNAGLVQAARGEGLNAMEGDATDARWLEEDVLTSDIGWVLTMTGNPDVDSVVARWGEERFGRGRGVRWPRADARPLSALGLLDATIAEGDERPGVRALDVVIEAIRDGIVEVAESPADEGIRVPIALVSGQRLVLAGHPAPAKKSIAIGLRERSASVAPPQGEGAPS